MQELAKKRRSCRNYNPDKEVPTSHLNYCLEAARWAPSACNRQPWFFTILQDGALRQRVIEKGLLPGIKHDWLHNAPCLVVLSVKAELITHRFAPFFSKVPYHFVDAGIAGEHFILAAAEQGLGTCWIGWIREKKIRKLVQLDKAHHVVALIPIGFPMAEDHFTDTSRSSRNPLDEIAAWL